MPASQSDSVYRKILLVICAAILILNVLEKIQYNAFYNKMTEVFC